jgi:transcription antitermination factor NusG
MLKKRKRWQRKAAPPAPTASQIRPLARPRIAIDETLAWFVAWTPAKGEERAARALTGYGIASYVPMQAAEVIRRGKTVVLTRPSLGRYVFVGLDPSRPDFAGVRSALGGDAPSTVEDVFSYLHRGCRVVVEVRQPTPPEPLGRLLRIAVYETDENGRSQKVGEEPMRLPVQALQLLEDRLSMFGSTGTAGGPRLAAGGAARVLSGPFADFLATVQHADDQRVRALLTVFGRETIAEFTPEQLEAA